MLKLRPFFLGLMLVLSLFLAGCTNLKNIRVLDYNVESLKLDQRVLEVNIEVKVDNPAKQLTLTELAGVISLGEEEIAVYDATPVVIPGHGIGSYPLVCRVEISEKLSLIRFLSLVKTAEMKDLNTDFQCRVKVKGGLRKKFQIEDLPLENLILRRHE